MGPKNKIHHRFISQMGVKRMGFCFRKDMEAGGIVHWNYKVKQQIALGFKFSTVNVVGPYWGMSVSSARAETKDKTNIFACKNKPCLAVLDTGTTLHSLDTA